MAFITLKPAYGMGGYGNEANIFSPAAKFTGYQYGGRPLGLTYVKYMNAGGDAMEGTEPTGGLTQDQIM